MSAHETVEVELKFDVDADQAAPDLSDLVPGGSSAAPQRYELRATYLDTATHDLAARKITLRRRTGGTDAGWHLKRPGSEADSRRELAVNFSDAPADGEIPATIREMLLAIVRNRALIPVAEIVTDRTVTVVQDVHGQSLAEFCDDKVIAHAHQTQHTQEWAEWEFELTGGDTALLKAARKKLRAAGARKASSASKLARAIGAEPHMHRPPALPSKATALELLVHILGVHFNTLVATDPLVRENAFDAVHQMRVTARKLRSVLTSFPEVLAPASIDGLTDELRALGEVLGDARDREVQLEINTALLARESDV
ncbi:MAG: CYTH domain-containing protein, partial [Gordonia sp. (in: high G+C Gram-positive bacteria)]|uniref:CYTH and CHAD domain-containing protein n=1 Tax=Gordonia sp. (in: high G+C Gram-positive bacteria) TaxID=84139 RepID=UPI003BB788B9